MNKSNTIPHRWLCCFLFFICPLLAQRPIISPGGVVNAASLAPVDQPRHGIAPGSIASIFGQNLAASTASSQVSPLPTSLNGTSVTVDGILAPLFYVSPTQVNFQVPSSIAAPIDAFAYSTSHVVVTTAAGASDSVSVDTLYEGIGVFSLDGSGCGRGAILNANPDGTVSLNSPSNSASPGSYISIFATGFGSVSNPPPDGSAALSSPLSISKVSPPGPGFWAGRAPGLIGVDQVNELVPPTSREGCAVPLGLGALNSVSVSIHAGGGQCVDGPSSSLGQILLKRSVVMNDNTIPETDTFGASFSSSPFQKLASPPVASSDLLAAQATAVCPPPGSTMLDAGPITLTFPGTPQPDIPPFQVQPTTKRGNLGYAAYLPGAAVQQGTFSISSAGGKDVGPFQISLQLPQDLQILSSFPKGTVIPGTGSSGLGGFGISWKGGVAGQMVTLKAIVHSTPDDFVQTYHVPATDHGISFIRMCQGLENPACILVEVGGENLTFRGADELDIEFGPDPTALSTISPSGLTLGGLVGWTYEYRFIGLKVGGSN